MSGMQMRQASRKAAKIKIGMGGVAGSGKTKSALRLAYGLCGDWKKICVLDSENDSSMLYSDLGPFWQIAINDPSPNTYVRALKTCVDEGIEVVVIDSISHEWEYLLELQTELTERDPKKNSYTAWAKITPMHNAFKKAILEAPLHIITTVRKKQEHAMVNENGKTSVQKLGLAPITRDGWEYEVTVNFDIDNSHYATTSKDRTNLFIDETPFQITEATGEMIKKWCDSGEAGDEILFNNASIEINNSNSISELMFVYNKYKELKDNQDFLAILKDKKSSLQ